MRKLSLIICLATIIVACKKDQPSALKMLTGKWEIRSSIGGIAGQHNKYPPGNGNILQLNPDSTYKRYVNDTLRNQGPFRIIKNGFSTGGVQKYDGIYFDNNQAGQYIALKTDTLIIGMDFDDGVETTYIRK